MRPLFTNAPDHWPRTVPDPAPDLVSWLAQALSDAGVSVLGAAVPHLTPEGVVEVPLRVREGQVDYEVFFYPEADEAAAAHFLAVLELAARAGNLRPVFFCPGDLLSVYAGELPAVARQGRLHLRKLEQPPRGQYAMWWGSPTETFETSPAAGLLDALCRRVDGLEPLFAAQILEELGAERFDPLELPAQMLSIPVEGPDRLPMVVSFSAERGVRFHFHTKQTPPDLRDLFLKHLLAYADLWLPQRPDETPGPTLRWWYAVNRRMQSVTVIDSPTPQGVAVLGSINR